MFAGRRGERRRGSNAPAEAPAEAGPEPTEAEARPPAAEQLTIAPPSPDAVQAMSPPSPDAVQAMSPPSPDAETEAMPISPAPASPAPASPAPRPASPASVPASPLGGGDIHPLDRDVHPLDRAPPAARDGPRRVLVLGGPGSGKAEQCRLLQRKLECGYVSCAELVRAEVKRDGKEGRALAELVTGGKVVPTRTHLALLRAELRVSGSASGLTLVEGFPKTVEAFALYEEALGPCDGVLLLEASEESMRQRCAMRYSRRTEAYDTPDAVERRIDAFNKQVRAVRARSPRRPPIAAARAPSTRRAARTGRASRGAAEREGAPARARRGGLDRRRLREVLRRPEAARVGPASAWPCGALDRSAHRALRFGAASDSCFHR